MPEETIASAAWRTCASVIPHPKLFQLFQPRGGVSAGLPGAAEAVEGAEAVENAVNTMAAAARRRSSRLPDRLGTGAPFREGQSDLYGARVQTADENRTIRWLITVH